MMTLTGRPALWTLVLLLVLGHATARAAVEASVDRSRIALGDTVQLIISATGDDEELSAVDLAPLQRDWEILSRSTRSNTTIVNGKRSHERQLHLEITPRRQGALSIPPFQLGSASTRELQVEVGDAPQIDPGADSVLFEASVDRDSVYVQGQLILTLRLQQAVNLDGRSISDLDLPDAFVVPLEQKSFQRQVNGRPWLVHEVRYAIFPEQSGTLTIPAQSFSARESVPRRSIFDTNRGRLVRLQSEALNIEVLPRPAAFTAATWLPARNIVIEEEWSSDPAQLRVGESITRTVRVRGEGLQGAQLPPVLLPEVDGIKHYPDQPVINDTEISSGLLGSRSDSVAIVATRAGRVELPAIEIPWWDTGARTMRTARIPARVLKVAAAAPTTATATTDGASSAASSGPEPVIVQSGAVRVWQVLALACALGWLLTAGLWWRSRREVTGGSEEPAPARSPKAAYKSLLAACAADQPQQARKQLILWAAARCDRGITSLEQAATLLADPALTSELKALEQSLYGQDADSWRGDQLRAIVERLQRQRPAGQPQRDEQLRLYPAA
ncbi:BatD family protein [Seongchinamella sediminis]|nr:BatD family protein [Seongchinamella sediminis]